MCNFDKIAFLYETVSLFNTTLSIFFSNSEYSNGPTQWPSLVWSRVD